jgi:long-subunit fatty acid transport protein
MTTRLNRNAFIALTCFITLGLTQGLLADGYRNPPLTAEAIGKSGNAIVFTDDASAIAHNPANLAFQKDGSIVISLTLAHLEHTFTAGDTGKKAEADDPWQPLPNIFLSYPIGDSGAVFGLGVTTPYGPSFPI